MPQTSPHPITVPCQLESLEHRRLLSSVDITRFGAVRDDGRDDTAALNAALRASGAGDTVVVPAGTFNFNSTVTIPSGISLKGTKGVSKMDFAVSRTAYAILIAGNASNVTIDGLTIHSNDGIIGLHSGRQYTNIAITNNDFMWGDDGTYYHRLAVHSTIRSEGLRVERNYFHDSPTSDRNVELWYMNDGSYSNNVFFNINDGGHIMEPQNNVAFDYNIGRRIHRMGVEIQGDTPGNNLQVVGNVFYDWVKPYYDTFGLSIVAHFRTNTLISQNYMLASHDGAWGLPDESGQNRFGFGIEAGFASGVVQNNIIAGPWAGGIVNSTKGNLVKNNTFYGHQLWASIMAEPGPYGMGSFTSIGNVFKDLSELPDPPATVDGVAPNWPVGGGTGTFDPDPTPGGPAPMLNAFVIDGTQILLSWHDNFTDESGYIVQRSRDGKTWADVWDSHAANITQYTDKGLPNGAQFYYRVGAYKKGTDGVYGVYSNIVAPKTKGIASGPGAGLNGFTRGLQRVPTNSQDPLDGLFGNNPIV